MEVNNLLNSKAFAYKKHHGTEIMLLGIVNDALKGFDKDNKTGIQLTPGSQINLSNKKIIFDQNDF